MFPKQHSYKKYPLIKKTVMRTRSLMLLITSLTAISFVACKKAETPALKIFTIKIGDCANIDAPSPLPAICFDSLVTESRCPEGAQCAWEGVAIVKLALKTETGNYSFMLSTIKSNTNLLPPNEILIGGYNIRLLKVLPYPSIVHPPIAEKTVELEIWH
jgi:hypothetical protein